MKTSKLMGTMVAVAALAAGLSAPTAALADRGGWDDRGRFEHRHFDRGHWKQGHWKHKHYNRGYYAPAYVVVPRPPVVVYPAPVYPAYAPVYPAYPGGSFSFSYSGSF